LSHDYAQPLLGVIIVSYCSSEVILPCLESLLASEQASLKIVVLDNASPDKTIENIRDWAFGRTNSNLPSDAPVGRIVPTVKPANFGEVRLEDAQNLHFSSLPNVILVRSPVNRGYAGGVNLGLHLLRRYPEINLFWVLNPDTVVHPRTAFAYVQTARAVGRFGLMGGRTLYYECPDEIQSDGGRVNAWTGMCANVNLGRVASTTKAPDPTTLDYIAGANLVASRDFLEQVGPMTEDYFLYYEEVDWACRRGDLTLAYAPDAVVYHYCGSSIGSATLRRRASAFANYFNYRNRMRFVRRFHPTHLPVAYGYSLLKVLRLVSIGAWMEAEAAARGLHNLPPPLTVRHHLSPEAAAFAFGKRRGRQLRSSESLS
jgi:hypothetical protein